MAKKATRKGVKTHNRRLILRSVFNGTADTRARLSQVTGLAKPTVSDIVNVLMQDGLLKEGGLGESTESGGKRPRLLRFHPDARQIIGVSVTDARVNAVLTNLQGDVVAQHRAYLDEVTGDMALTYLTEAINGLVAQLDAPLLCISIGTPGIVNTQRGIIQDAPSLEWYSLPLAEQLTTLYDVPVFVGNNTELATRAHFAFRQESDMQNLVTVLINTSVEIGMAFGGRYHHSGDLGLLRVGDQGEQLTAYLGWRYIKQRIAQLRLEYPDTQVPDAGVRYLHVRNGYNQGDPLCEALYSELGRHLAQVFAWITGLMRPDQIVLAGGITELGPRLLDLATQYAADLISPSLLDAVRFDMADDMTLATSGAVALAMERELGIL